jgi:hypothetical protein
LNRIDRDLVLDGSGVELEPRLGTLNMRIGLGIGLLNEGSGDRRVGVCMRAVKGVRVPGKIAI